MAHSCSVIQGEATNFLGDLKHRVVVVPRRINELYELIKSTEARLTQDNNGDTDRAGKNADEAMDEDDANADMEMAADSADEETTDWDPEIARVNMALWQSQLAILRNWPIAFYDLGTTITHTL